MHWNGIFSKLWFLSFDVENITKLTKNSDIVLIWKFSLYDIHLRSKSQGINVIAENLKVSLFFVHLIRNTPFASQ